MAENLNIVIRAFDKTAKGFGGAIKGLRAVAGKVINLKSALLGVVGVGGFGALIKQGLASGDALAKTSDKIGVTTEALSGLRFAAELTGVSAGTMDMALQRATRRISEAAKGSGEAVGALLELGINAKELSQIPLDKQMGVIADAMGEVDTQADRVRLAMKLFDSEGVALVNTLAGGSEGLLKMAADAEKLGLSMSRIDTAQIEAANNAITASKGVFAGLTNQLTVAFSPIIESIATGFRQSALDSADFGTTGQRVADAIVTAFAKVKGAIHSVSIFVKQVQLKFMEFGDFLSNGFVNSLKGFIDVADAINAYLGKPLVGDALNEHFSETKASIEALKIEIIQMKEMDPSTGILAAYELIKEESRRTAEVVAANSPAAILAAEGDKAFKKETFQEKIKKKAAIDLAKFEALTATEKTQTVTGQLSKQFAASAGHSKKMFAMQKAMAIGQAIMNTYSGASKALSAYPPPLNYLMAAGVVAAGLGQVAQIRSQSFEGGGFTGSGSRSGGIDGKGGFAAILHPNETVVDHTQGQGMGQSVNINIHANDTKGFDQLLESRRGQIMGMINQAMNNRGVSSLA